MTHNFSKKREREQNDIKYMGKNAKITYVNPIMQIIIINAIEQNIN